MTEHTSDFCFTLEKATEIANRWTKGESTEGFDFPRQYNTCIKGKSIYTDSLGEDHCWAVTNRFDPDVRKTLIGKQNGI